MNRGLGLRIVCCLIALSCALYSYIDQQNAVTQLRIQIPALAKEIQGIREENTRFQYEIDQFENPAHLMELARHSEFSHLRHPLVKEVLTLREGVAVQVTPPEEKEFTSVKPQPTLAIGVN